MITCKRHPNGGCWEVCGGCAVIAQLDALPPMTPEQQEAQRRSFAFGNVSIHNPNVTRELIDQVADEMEASDE